jgi:hypothetical protein
MRAERRADGRGRATNSEFCAPSPVRASRGHPVPQGERESGAPPIVFVYYFFPNAQAGSGGPNASSPEIFARIL